MGGGGGKGATVAVGVGCHETRLVEAELPVNAAEGAEDPEIRLFQFKFVADVGADSKLGSCAATL